MTDVLRDLIWSTDKD